MPIETARISAVNKAPDINNAVENAPPDIPDRELMQPDHPTETLLPPDSHGDKTKDLIARYKNGEIDIVELQKECPRGLGAMGKLAAEGAVNKYVASQDNPHKGPTGLELANQKRQEREARAAKKDAQPAAKKTEVLSKTREMPKTVAPDTIAINNVEPPVIKLMPTKALLVGRPNPRIQPEKVPTTTQAEQSQTITESEKMTNDVDDTIQNFVLKKQAEKPITKFEIPAAQVLEIKPINRIETITLPVTLSEVEQVDDYTHIESSEISHQSDTPLTETEEIVTQDATDTKDTASLAIEHETKRQFLAADEVFTIDVSLLDDPVTDTLEPMQPFIEQDEDFTQVDVSTETTDNTVTPEAVFLEPIMVNIEAQAPEIVEELLPLLKAVQDEVADLIKVLDTDVISPAEIEPSQELINMCTELFEKLDLPHSEADIRKFILNLIKAKELTSEKDDLWGKYLYTDSEGDHERRQINAQLSLKTFVKTHNFLGRLALSVRV